MLAAVLGTSPPLMATDVLFFCFLTCFVSVDVLLGNGTICQGCRPWFPLHRPRTEFPCAVQPFKTTRLSHFNTVKGFTWQELKHYDTMVLICPQLLGYIFWCSIWFSFSHLVVGGWCLAFFLLCPFYIWVFSFSLPLLLTVYIVCLFLRI